MKHVKSLSLLLAGVLITVTLFSFIESKKETHEQTEEYAIIVVSESGKNKTIRICVGSQPATEKVTEKQKTDVAGDLSPVIKELQTLNEQGFELINESTSHFVNGGGGNTISIPTYTFIMKKKLR